MERSRELFEKAKKLIPGGVNSPVRAYEPYPFFVSRAEGSRIYDVDGNVYVDYVMGYGALLLGHVHPTYIENLRKALEDGVLYGAPTEEEVILAEKIKRFYPSVEMIRLVNSGTEATMHAIRLARGYTGRRKVLKFEGCYHGAHDVVLVKAGSGALTFGTPSSRGVLEETAKYTLVSRYNDIDSTERIVRENRDDLAAIIVEPVVANVGLIKPRPDFLKSLRELADYSGAVLIFDEIVTGFRLAPGGAQEYFKIKADMTTLGKVLGGGLPISAFGGKEEIMRNLAPAGKVYQAGTYSGNPLSTKAALTVLDIIDKNRGIYEQMKNRVEKLSKMISWFIEERKLPLTITHIESMFQLFFTPEEVKSYEDVRKSDINWFKQYFLEMLKLGVFVPPSQFETCFLSAAHSDEDIEKTVEAMKKALSALQR